MKDNATDDNQPQGIADEASSQVEPTRYRMMLDLGLLEVADKSVPSLILLTLFLSSAEKSLYRDIGLLGPSLAFKKVPESFLMSMLPMLKEDKYQGLQPQAMIHAAGFLSAVVMALGYSFFYRLIDKDRLADLNDGQHNAIETLVEYQSADILNQFVKICLIHSDNKNKFLFAKLSAAFIQCTILLFKKDLTLESYIESELYGLLVQLLISAILVFPILKNISRQSMNGLRTIVIDFVFRSLCNAFHKGFDFKMVSTINQKLDGFDLVGEQYILEGAMAMFQAFVTGIAKAGQRKIAAIYHSHKQQAYAFGNQFVRNNSLISLTSPVMHAVTAYFVAPKNIVFFLLMGIGEMTKIIKDSILEINRGANHTFIPTVVDISLLVSTAWLLKSQTRIVF